MAERTTYISLDRNILKWRWYKDANTMRLFVHLILTANIRDADFEKITVHRGQLVTSYPHLAQALGISVKSVRTALGHLKETGEVAVKTYPKYSLITVLNFSYYQKRWQGNGQSKGSQRAVNGQQSNNSNNIINIKPASPTESSGSYYDEDAW